MEWLLIKANNGMPTVQVNKVGKQLMIHSKYDPVKEAERWVEGNFLSITTGIQRIVIIGVGLGYHVKVLASKYPTLPILAWDFNEEFYEWVTEKGLLEWLKFHPNVIYRVSEDLKVINKELMTLLSKEKVEVLFHFASLELIPSKLEGIKQIFDQHVIFLRSIRRQAEKMSQNFSLNRNLNDDNILNWLNKFSNKPGILVSAGPSLTKRLPALKKIQQKKKVVIGCVGTALKPLIEQQIYPDFIMIADPLDIIEKQFEGLGKLDIPLFYLATASSAAVNNYSGPRFIVYQKGYHLSEEEATKYKIPLIQTGGSVATCLLDLMVLMGCKPIALLGQDLAYTGGSSHAENTVAKREVSSEISDISIKDYYQLGEIGTSKSLYSYLKWFSRYVEEKTDKEGFWNCTEGGAYIPGWKHRALKEFYDLYGK